MDGAFVDRLDAGQKLAEVLEGYRETNAMVLGLPRGGVMVGYAVARELRLPLQALVVRKVRSPQNPELAIGAVSETGIRWLDPQLVRATGADDDYLRQEVAQQVAEAGRRQQEYSIGPGLTAVAGRAAIVVDDGIATGATALVGARSVRDLGASEVVLAAPVASPQAAGFLEPAVDRLVVLAMPEPFMAVGMHYRYFDQISDAEVIHYLRVAND